MLRSAKDRQGVLLSCAPVRTPVLGLLPGGMCAADGASHPAVCFPAGMQCCACLMW